MTLLTQGTNLSLESGLAAAATTYKTAFDQFFVNAQPGAYQMYTEKVNTSGATTVDFRFLTRHPQMREMKGTRDKKFLRSYNFSAKVKTFESSLEFKRTDVQYDPTGLVGKAIRDYLGASAQAYDQAVVAEYDSASGAGPTCYDGVALFSASHVHGSAGATQSNLSAGTNLSWAAFNTARTAMRQLLLENGEPARIAPTHMRVGPALESRAKEILQAKERIVFSNASAAEATSSVINATARTNIWAGELDLIVDDRITTYYWDLLDLSKPGMRPMYLLEGMAPTPAIIDQLQYASVFARDVFEYGLIGDYTPAPGHWMTAYRATGTA